MGRCESDEHGTRARPPYSSNGLHLGSVLPQTASVRYKSLEADCDLKLAKTAQPLPLFLYTAPSPSAFAIGHFVDKDSFKSLACISPPK